MKNKILIFFLAISTSALAQPTGWLPGPVIISKPGSGGSSSSSSSSGIVVSNSIAISWTKNTSYTNATIYYADVSSGVSANAVAGQSSEFSFYIDADADGTWDLKQPTSVGVTDSISAWGGVLRGIIPPGGIFLFTNTVVGGGTSSLVASSGAITYYSTNAAGSGGGDVYISGLAAGSYPIAGAALVNDSVNSNKLDSATRALLGGSGAVTFEPTQFGIGNGKTNIISGVKTTNAVNYAEAGGMIVDKDNGDNLLQYESSSFQSTQAGLRSAVGIISELGFEGNGESLTNLSASSIASGTVPPANLGSGSSITTKFLRGDSTWQTIGGGGDMLAANNLSDVASTNAARTNIAAHNASNLTVGSLPDSRLNSTVTLDTKWDTIAEIETVVGRKFATNNATLPATSLLVGDGARGVAPTTTGSGVLTALGNTANASGGFLTYDADLVTIGGLADPNADRILFWDDTAGAYAYLTAGSGLSITGTTISSTGAGSTNITDSAAYTITVNSNIIVNGNATFYGSTAFSNLYSTNFFIAGQSNGIAAIQSDGSVKATNTPVVTSVDLGLVTDTTLARSSAGNVSIEGNVVYRAGGTDVAVADGGTGLSSGTSGGILGYTASGTLASSVALGAGNLVVGGGAGATPTSVTAGATTTILVGGGASTAPVWTTATGTGSPVRADGPTLTAPVLGTIASGNGAALTALSAANITAGGVLPGLNAGSLTNINNDAPTNTFTINTAFPVGQTNQVLTAGAVTGGITGIANGPSSGSRWGEMTVFPTGAFVFTNPASIKASDGLTTRTLTNGTVVEIAIKVVTGRSTNMAIVHFP